MPPVRLSGQLICADDQDAAIVAQHLPLHQYLSRAEPGCLTFEVHRTDDPHVWQVDEEFADDAAFAAHQERAANSEWGRATAGIERRYRVEETTEAPVESMPKPSGAARETEAPEVR